MNYRIIPTKSPYPSVPLHFDITDEGDYCVMIVGVGTKDGKKDWIEKENWYSLENLICQSSSREVTE